uniref:HTTM domain protein n=1 Tax=Sphingobacterium sp. (strain 21) TaxID=743722 RepID=F4C9S8_SPHS2
MILNTIHRKVNEFIPWTNVYGIARSLIAINTLSTLLFNHSEVLFIRNTPQELMGLSHRLIYRYNFFNLFPSTEIARFAAIFFLILVIIGWMPRITAILHFYITLSFLIMCVFIDGGDQVATVLTLLLVPIAAGDKRHWHFGKSLPMNQSHNFYMKCVAWFAYIAIRLQVAIIYLHAGTGKFVSNEWVNGTAVWYWFNDPMFGANYYVNLVLTPMLKSPVIIFFITWGSMVLEILLFLALTMKTSYRKQILLAGILFHLSIFVIQGLFSFFFSMTAALLLYLYPINEQIRFRLPSLKQKEVDDRETTIFRRRSAVDI